MTLQRAEELLDIEMKCVKRASGLEYDLRRQDWIETGDVCNRDCANCGLVQDSKELLDMYLYVGTILRKERLKAEKKEAKKDFTRMYGEFEKKYNPYPVQMSRQEAFMRALSDGLITRRVYDEAKDYFGNLWTYVGD